MGIPGSALSLLLMALAGLKGASVEVDVLISVGGTFIVVLDVAPPSLVSLMLGIPDDLDVERNDPECCLINLPRLDREEEDGFRILTEASRTARTRSAARFVCDNDWHSRRMMLRSSSLFIE